MHPLAAERLAKYLGVHLFVEYEDLKELAIADYRVTVTRQRQPALVAKGPVHILQIYQTPSVSQN